MASIIATAEIADYLNDTVAPNGGIVTYEDRNQVIINRNALGILKELDNDSDGFYDGRAIWIGGTDYPVTR